jgi:hypothetical protein
MPERCRTHVPVSKGDRGNKNYGDLYLIKGAGFLKKEDF